MAKVCRDVLIVSRLSYLSEKAMEKEMERVSRLLYGVEAIQHHCRSVELIDIARHKITRKPQHVIEALRQKQNKPFVFTFHRN